MSWLRGAGRARTPIAGGGPAGRPADAWIAEADAVVLNRIDEVDAHARPAGVGKSYPEHEYEALGVEQDAAWAAEGEQAARPSQVRAHGQAIPAAAATFLLAQHQEEVQAAYADHRHAQRLLQPHVRREPAAKLRYWIVWPLLALGDASGVLSAAISLGDLPWVAAWQALSAGLAAACAGLVGSELKHLQLASARQRDPEALTADEVRYRRLFAGPSGMGVVKLVSLLSFLVILLLMVGIFALRSAVEGTTSGLTFSLLAAATALGSGLLGYSAADEVADLLATLAKRVQRAEKRHQALARATAIRIYAESAATARSIQAEHQHRGRAAHQRIMSLLWRILRRNSQVFGHGFPSGDSGGVIGRRTRRDGAK
jgi:hypothetical protein